jgi:CcmD family protein
MIRNAEYVIAAYSIVSTVLVMYTAFIHIKLHKVNKRLKQLSEKNKDE